MEYTRTQSYTKIQINDFNVWWNLRGTMSTPRLGRYAGTHTIEKNRQRLDEGPKNGRAKFQGLSPVNVVNTFNFVRKHVQFT